MVVVQPHPMRLLRGGNSMLSLNKSKTTEFYEFQRMLEKITTLVKLDLKKEKMKTQLIS